MLMQCAQINCCNCKPIHLHHHVWTFLFIYLICLFKENTFDTFGSKYNFELSVCLLVKEL